MAAPWPRWSRCRPRRRAVVASCGVGCGGPMDAGRRPGLAAQHPRVAGVPPPRPPGRRDRACPTLVDNDAKALALGEGWAGAARGARDYLAMVVSTGRGRRHRARRAPPGRGGRQRRPHRPRHRRARRPAVRRAAPGGASRPWRRARRSSGSPAGRRATRPATSGRRTGRSSGGRGRRGQPAGPAPGRGRRLGRARLRRPTSSGAAQAELDASCPARLLRRRPRPPRRPGRRRADRRCGGGGDPPRSPDARGPSTAAARPPGGVRGRT